MNGGGGCCAVTAAATTTMLLMIVIVVGVIGGVASSGDDTNATATSTADGKQLLCIQCNPCVGRLPNPTVCEPKNTLLRDKILADLYPLRACTKIVGESASGVITTRGCTWYDGNKTTECADEHNCIYYCKGSGCNAAAAVTRRADGSSSLFPLLASPLFIWLLTQLLLLAMSSISEDPGIRPD